MRGDRESENQSRIAVTLFVQCRNRVQTLSRPFENETTIRLRSQIEARSRRSGHGRRHCPIAWRKPDFCPARCDRNRKIDTARFEEIDRAQRCAAADFDGRYWVPNRTSTERGGTLKHCREIAAASSYQRRK